MRENIAYIFLLGCFNLLIFLLFNDCRHLSVSRSKATHTYGLDCDESAIPVESGLFVARRYSGGISGVSGVSGVLRARVNWVAVSL